MCRAEKWTGPYLVPTLPINVMHVYVLYKFTSCIVFGLYMYTSFLCTVHAHQIMQLPVLEPVTSEILSKPYLQYDQILHIN